MTNNGAPQLTAEDKGNGRTIVTVGTVPNSGASAAPPVRRSVADARAIPAQASAQDGHTASMPAIGTASQPPAGPTPVVNPPAAPAPATPTTSVADNKENTVLKHKLTFQHFVPSVAALLSIGVLAVFVGLFELPVLGAAFLLAIAPVLVLLVAFVRRAKVTLTDQVKGNAYGPVIAASVISALLTSVIVLLATNPSVIGSVLSSDFFWALLIVAVLAFVLFKLQGANLDKTSSNSKEK